MSIVSTGIREAASVVFKSSAVDVGGREVALKLPAVAFKGDIARFGATADPEMLALVSNAVGAKMDTRAAVLFSERVIGKERSFEATLPLVQQFDKLYETFGRKAPENTAGSNSLEADLWQKHPHTRLVSAIKTADQGVTAATYFMAHGAPEDAKQALWQGYFHAATIADALRIIELDAKLFCPQGASTQPGIFQRAVNFFKSTPEEAIVSRYEDALYERAKTPAEKAAVIASAEKLGFGPGLAKKIKNHTDFEAVAAKEDAAADQFSKARQAALAQEQAELAEARKVYLYNRGETP